MDQSKRIIQDLITDIELTLRKLIRTCGNNDIIQPAINISTNDVINQIYIEVQALSNEYFSSSYSNDPVSWHFNDTLSPYQLSLLKPKQINYLTNTLISTITIQSLSLEFLKSLTAEQLNFFKYEQIKAMSTSQKQQLESVVTKNKTIINDRIISALNDEIRISSTISIEIEQLKILTPEQIRLFNNSQLLSLNLKVLPHTLLASLTTEQLQTFTANQCRILLEMKSIFTAEQLAVLQRAEYSMPTDANPDISTIPSRLNDVTIATPNVINYNKLVEKEENEDITNNTSIQKGNNNNIIDFWRQTIMPSLDDVLSGGSLLNTANLDQLIYEKLTNIYEIYTVFNNDISIILATLLIRPDILEEFFNSSKINNRELIKNIIIRSFFIKVPFFPTDIKNTIDMIIFKEKEPLITFPDVDKDTKIYKNLKKIFFQSTTPEHENNVVFTFRIIKKLYELQLENNLNKIFTSTEKKLIVIYFIRNLQIKIKYYQDLLQILDNYKDQLFNLYLTNIFKETKLYAYIIKVSDNNTLTINDINYNLYAAKIVDNAYKVQVKDTQGDIIYNLGIVNGDIESHDYTAIIEKINSGENIIIIQHSYDENCKITALTKHRNNNNQGVIPFICATQTVYNAINIEAYEILSNISKPTEFIKNKIEVIGSDVSLIPTNVNDIATILENIFKYRTTYISKANTPYHSSNLFICITFLINKVPKVKIVICDFATFIEEDNELSIQDILLLNDSYKKQNKDINFDLSPCIDNNFYSNLLKESILKISNFINEKHGSRIKVSTNNFCPPIEIIKEFMKSHKYLSDNFIQKYENQNQSLSNIKTTLESSIHGSDETNLINYIILCQLEINYKIHKYQYNLLKTQKNNFFNIMRKLIIRYSQYKFFDGNPLLYTYPHILGCHEKNYKFLYRYNYNVYDESAKLFDFLNETFTIDPKLTSFALFSIIDLKNPSFIQYFDISKLKYTFNALLFIRNYKKSKKYLSASPKNKDTDNKYITDIINLINTYYNVFKIEIKKHTFFNKLINSSPIFTRLMNITLINLTIENLQNIKKLIILIDNYNINTTFGTLEIGRILELQDNDFNYYTCSPNSFNIEISLEKLYNNTKQILNK